MLAHFAQYVQPSDAQYQQQVDQQPRVQKIHEVLVKHRETTDN